MLRQHAASETPNVQVFDGYQSVLIHQHASEFVLMVETLVEDVLVNLTQEHDCLAAAI